MIHLLGYGRWICSGELGEQEMLFKNFEGWDGKELTGLCMWCEQWMEKDVVVPYRPSSEPLRKSLCCDLPGLCTGTVTREMLMFPTKRKNFSI